MVAPVSIFLDGDNSWPELKNDFRFLEGELTGVAYLAGGMESGHPSVTLRGKTSDGKEVLLQTSARNFIIAGAAIRGKAQRDGFDF